MYINLLSGECCQHLPKNIKLYVNFLTFFIIEICTYSNAFLNVFNQCYEVSKREIDYHENNKIACFFVR